MNNIPMIKPGLLAVSRDCFPIELSRKRRADLEKACFTKSVDLTVIETIIEGEKDIPKALEEIQQQGINTLIIYLGNFGPEGPTSSLAQKFDGPFMLAAAAEESKNDLIQGRGDAFCGMLNIAYNMGLRHLVPHIPEYPVGTAEEVAEKIKDFLPMARVVLGLKKLKIFSFGPRPHDFVVCHAPIKPLYDLGVEIMENSELDLYDVFLSAENHPQIESVAKDMADSLGQGNAYPDLLNKLAQYEVALQQFFKENLGNSEFGVFANKCWPAFEKYFGFVPCYVNSRLATKGIPVACESDIYGALSEYLALCATELPATLLDINNTVPKDMYEEASSKVKEYKPEDLFMGFHCGNTSGSCLVDSELKYQLIMHRLMESGKKPDITRGTLEGRIKPGELTLFRIQSAADTTLQAYIAEGEVLDIETRTFGGSGVFAIKEMGRFYRHVLIENKFPHHTSAVFSHAGKALFGALKMLGIKNIGFNQPEEKLYKSECPFD